MRSRSPVPFVATPMPVVASPLVRDDVVLADIEPADWDALAPGIPFLSHAFLTALHRPCWESPRTGCAL